MQRQLVASKENDPNESEELSCPLKSVSTGRSEDVAAPPQQENTKSAQGSETNPVPPFPRLSSSATTSEDDLLLPQQRNNVSVQASGDDVVPPRHQGSPPTLAKEQNVLGVHQQSTLTTKSEEKRVVSAAQSTAEEQAAELAEQVALTLLLDEPESSCMGQLQGTPGQMDDTDTGTQHSDASTQTKDYDGIHNNPKENIPAPLVREIFNPYGDQVNETSEPGDDSGVLSCGQRNVSPQTYKQRTRRTYHNDPGHRQSDASAQTMYYYKKYHNPTRMIPAKVLWEVYNPIRDQENDVSSSVEESGLLLPGQRSVSTQTYRERATVLFPNL